MKKTILFLLLISGFVFGQNINDAKALLKQNPESYEAKKILDKIVSQEPNNAEAYYIIAEYYHKKGMSNYVRNNMEKAIKLAPDNLDYRWFRAYSVGAGSTNKEQLDTAIGDLHYILDKGQETGKLYFLLGRLYIDRARVQKFNFKPNENKSFSDDNSQKEKSIAENDAKVKEMLQKAQNYLIKSKEIANTDIGLYIVEIERLLKLIHAN